MDIRRPSTLLALALCGVAGSLMAQGSEPLDPQQLALRDAKARANVAERRSELLRQEASNAITVADRLIAQRAVLSAEMDAAQAQIDAANARIAMVARSQRLQRAQLGRESEPVLRLNAALQQMTGRPTALMIAQPGRQKDYIHLRAVMSTVQPEIARRTAALRSQIAEQNELRAQEVAALKSLNVARARLRTRRSAIAKLEGGALGRAGDFSANAAVEFEQAIAQGEQARDIVANIDSQRLSGEKAALLAALDGPTMRQDTARRPHGRSVVYLLPASGPIVSGFNELNATGYRERGVRLSVTAASPVTAPASGQVSFAGRYRSYGQIVIIEHGAGWNTVITNLDSVSVMKGQNVVQGAVVGTAGRDYLDIGVELRRNGRVMDIAAMIG